MGVKGWLVAKSSQELRLEWMVVVRSWPPILCNAAATSCLSKATSGKRMARSSMANSSDVHLASI